MCSPHCWFVFYHCESQFIASLQADHSKHSLINLFHNNCRYIDEILTVNDPNFLTFVKQFIPRNFLWMKLISQAIRVNFFIYTYPFFKVNLTNAFATKRRFFFPYRKFSLFLGWWRPFSLIIWRLYFSVSLFVHMHSNASDFKDRNIVITEKLLHQGCRFHKLLKAFTKLY